LPKIGRKRYGTVYVVIRRCSIVCEPSQRDDLISEDTIPSDTSTGSVSTGGRNVP
jgi:hypothetical protein